MSETHISIGQVKRDISELVNRVAYGGECIVLTSRGKPKAAIVSMEDYQRLQVERAEQEQRRWQAWRVESAALNEDILARRQGQPLDVEALWQASRAELEAHDDDIRGG
jgi:prevent-host-death family protein